MNPLNRIGVPNTSRQEDTVNPEAPLGAVTPVGETQPKFNAYRGDEFHGVDGPPAEAFDTDYGATEKVEYEEGHPEPDAVPVRIVQDDKREQPVFRTQQYTLTDRLAHKVVAGDKRISRVRIFMLTAATETVMVSSEENPLQTGVRLYGFTQGHGAVGPQVLEILEPCNDIWVQIEGSPDITIGILVEYGRNV